MISSIATFLLGMVVFIPGFAYFGEAPTEMPSVMNDIKFEDYKDFTKTWHLVTVRYRTDSNELRFTYANDQAWKEMNSSKQEYTDGAIFAKVGLITEKDPAFVSSEVPSGAKRFQFMVRNKKKYKDTQGWGYALFDSKGKIFDEEIKKKTLACAACHNIVPERNYVFSRPMNLGLGENFLEIKPSANEKSITFIAKSIKIFDPQFQKNLNEDTLEVYSLEGNLKKNYFSGTLDEIVPLLLDHTKKQRQTSTLYLDQQNYSLVKPSKSSANCTDGKVNYEITIFFKGSTVRKTSICY